jgi:hypothetical protein
MNQSLTKRHLSYKVIQAVYERDKFACIICGKTINLDIPHHAWYGLEAQYNHNRNNLNQLVTLCIDDHRNIHADIGNQINREICKQYLLNYSI